MKVSRVLLVCTLFLLAAVPTFAAPPCTYCIEEGIGPCDNDPGAGTRCRLTSGSCQTIFAFCLNHAAPTSVVSEWSVVSIEVSRPDATTATVVSNPNAVAQNDTPRDDAKN